MDINIVNLEHGVSFRALNAGREITGVSEEPNTAPDNTAGDLTVNLTLEEGLLNVVPAALTVKANVTATGLNPDDNGWDETIAEPAIAMTYGDLGAVYTIANGLRAAHQDRNQSIGYRGTHVYRKPGTYTVNCVVYWKGQMATASATFTALDREAVFSASQTILIDPTGSFAGAPAATRQYTSWAELLSQHPNGIWSEPQVQVLFAPGQVIDCNAGQWWARQLGSMHISIGCWDIDDFATIDVTALDPTWIPYGMKNRQFQAFNLHIKGQWNALTEQGNGNGGFSTPDANGDAVFDRISFDGLGVGVDVQEGGTADGSHPARVIVHECYHTNHKNQIVFGNCINNGVSIVGCMVDPDDLHLYGGHARDNYTTSLHGQYQRNSDGGIRFARTRYLIVQNCVMRGQAGWAPQGSPGQTQPVLFQSGMRYLSGENIGQEVLFTQSLMDIRVVTAFGGGGGDETRLKGIFDSCTFINQIGSIRAFEINQSGHVIQNCHIIVPDLPATPFSGPFDNVFGTGVSKTPYPEVAVGWPIIVRNNTIEVLLSEANKGGFNEGGSLFSLDPALAATLVEHDNILEAPNLGVPISAGQSLRSFSGYSVARPGPVFGWHGQSGTLVSDVASGGTLRIPYGFDFAGRQVGQSDFSGYDGRGVIQLNGTRFRTSATDGNEISVSFTATDIEVTNLSSITWVAGQAWGIDISRGSSPEAPNPYWAFYLDVENFELQSGAAGFESASLEATPLNIDGQPRGASPSQGAY